MVLVQGVLSEIPPACPRARIAAALAQGVLPHAARGDAGRCRIRREHPCCRAGRLSKRVRITSAAGRPLEDRKPSPRTGAWGSVSSWCAAAGGGQGCGNQVSKTLSCFPAGRLSRRVRSTSAAGRPLEDRKPSPRTGVWGPVRSCACSAKWRDPQGPGQEDSFLFCGR